MKLREVGVRSIWCYCYALHNAPLQPRTVHLEMGENGDGKGKKPPKNVSCRITFGIFVLFGGKKRRATPVQDETLSNGRKRTFIKTKLGERRGQKMREKESNRKNAIFFSFPPDHRLLLLFSPVCMYVHTTRHECMYNGHDTAIKLMVRYGKWWNKKKKSFASVFKTLFLSFSVVT